MADEHQAHRVFAGLVDGQIVSAEMVASGCKRCNVLITGGANGDPGDALNAVTAGRDERGDDTRLGLEDLDDLLDRPADVIGGIEVQLEQAAVRESALLDGLCSLAGSCAADADRLQVFLGYRVAVVIASGEGGA